MKKCLITCAALAVWMLAASSMPSQERRPRDEETQSPTRLPSGKLQMEEILKAEHEKSVKDAAQLIDLAEGLKAELEKDDTHVLSISSLKKTEEIEKIAKRIRARLKRF